MTILLLVRHGETDWNRDGRWQGHADRPLTDVGRRQAAAAAGALAAAQPTAIYSSDLERARETAAPLAGRTGLVVGVRRALREIDVGSWSGLTRREIEERRLAGPAERATGTPGWTGGETMEAHASRMLAALTAIVAAHAPGDRVCVFTHGGSIRAVVAASLGLDPRESRDRLSGSRYCAVTSLLAVRSDVRAPAWMLLGYNADPAGTLSLS